MLYAQRAFTQAHPDSIVEIRKLMASWIIKKKVTVEEYKTKVPPAAVTPEQLYTLFKIHYSTKVKELFTDSKWARNTRQTISRNAPRSDWKGLKMDSQN